MKYRTKRSLNSMWLEMFNYYYDMNKRAMGGELTPYGKEECRRQVNEFLNEVEGEKRDRLYDILSGKRQERVRRMMVFVRFIPACREVHYKPVWEAKTGNILTRSTISAEQAVRLHENKLETLGITVRKVVYC